MIFLLTYTTRVYLEFPAAIPLRLCANVLQLLDSAYEAINSFSAEVCSQLPDRENAVGRWSYEASPASAHFALGSLTELWIVRVIDSPLWSTLVNSDLSLLTLSCSPDFTI